MPVLGDGVTHYYHQGPVFVDNANETLEQELRVTLTKIQMRKTRERLRVLT